VKPITLLLSYFSKIYESTDHWLVLPVIAFTVLRGNPWYEGAFLWLCFSVIFMVWCAGLCMFFPKSVRPNALLVISRPVAHLVELWFSLPLVFCVDWAKAESARLQAEIDALDAQES